MNNQIFVLTPADMLEDIDAEFYVIERFPDPCFVTDQDGEIKTFPTYAAARQEAADCQDGYVLIF